MQATSGKQVVGQKKRHFWNQDDTSLDERGVSMGLYLT